jgi:hypothetical protein
LVCEVRLDQVNGAMKEEIPLGLEPVSDGAATKPSRQELFSMPTSMLYRREATMFSRTGAPNLFQRANRPGESDIARWDTRHVFGRANLRPAIRCARWNMSHALQSTHPPQIHPPHCQT